MNSMWTLTKYLGGWDQHVASTFGSNPRTLFDLLLLFVCLRETRGNECLALRLRCWANGKEIVAAVYESPEEIRRRRAQRRVLAQATWAP